MVYSIHSGHDDTWITLREISSVKRSIVSSTVLSTENMQPSTVSSTVYTMECAIGHAMMQVTHGLIHVTQHHALRP